MSDWRFFCYRSPQGARPIADWYQALSVKEQAVWDDVHAFLSQLQRWEYPHYRRLQGFDELGEIRFKADKKQHRVLGVFHPGKRFIILLGCTHKQKVYSPANALTTADQRRKQLREGQASIYEYDL